MRAPQEHHGASTEAPELGARAAAGDAAGALAAGGVGAAAERAPEARAGGGEVEFGGEHAV